jgi:hypothetical protein
MKPYFSKKHQLFITAALVGIIFLAALIFPGQINARQELTNPTPTTTPLPDELTTESGNTQDLMWGAGMILFIIIGGVLVQRIILKANSDNIEKTN